MPERQYVQSTDQSIYKFTSKERDNESNYDYFGARYYDSRIGRWGGVEPKLDKYVSWSPYNYSACNPIKLFDLDGLELDLGGNQTTGLYDLRSMLPEKEQYRIDNNSGVVSFDESGLDIHQDAAYELLHNLVTSENKFLYEVAENTSGVDRNSKEEVPLSVSNDQGSENLSVTPRNNNGGTGTQGLLPKDGYYGQVTLGTGHWTPWPGGNGQIARSDVVFHELMENLLRSQGLPYSWKTNEKGAHDQAVKAASNYKSQKAQPPGKVGHYEFP